MINRGAILVTGGLLFSLATTVALLYGTVSDLDNTLATPILADSQRHQKTARQREVATRFEQGVAMLQMGQYEHAITAFHRVLVLAPRLPEAHINMGFALYELKDFSGAERFFRGSLALSAENPNALYGLSISLFSLGDFTAAREAMIRFLDIASPDDPFRAKAEMKLAEIVAGSGKKPGQSGTYDQSRSR